MALYYIIYSSNKDSMSLITDWRWIFLISILTVNECYVQTQGILVGFDNLDGVIRIIREASSNSIAAAGLRNGELLI
jgi:hypothetical protein